MSDTVVDRIFREFEDLASYLRGKAEISFQNTVDENFRKALLMASASYFEYRIREMLEQFARNSSNDNQLLVEFMKNKAISRQYHTYFEWDSRNANSFFRLFGDVFKDFMRSQVENDKHLDKAIKAFIEIGQDRNRLVHQDFGTFSIEKTAREIYELYKAAKIFVEKFPSKLEEGLIRIQASDMETRV